MTRKAGRGGKVVATLTGPARAALYRLAAGTGFRANEIRQLTRVCFRLEGEEPEIVLPWAAEKNRKGTAQPIARSLAAHLRPFVAAAPEGGPVFDPPEKTAEMLRADLARAGIAPKAADGTEVDFHAIRHTFVSNLIERGVDVKTAQTLARHSSVTLTIGIYTTARKDRLRKALEDEEV